ncbi:MAG: MraY family glycosyltransferase [Candidatus Omnitrophota bacterium]
MIYLICILVTFIIAVFLTPFTIKISKGLDIFSRPKKDSDKRMPCLGGIAIFVSFIIAMALFYKYVNGFGVKLIGLVVSSGLIVALGFLDDMKDLSPFKKIIVELIAIAIMIFFGIHIKTVYLPGFLNILLTVAWMIFIINAFNLLDIADGLASGLAVIISSSLLVISAIKGDSLSSIVLAGFIGANLGFLLYNFNPAKLYMGDTGSLFLGFLLGVASINISYAPINRPIALLTPIVVLSLPIYDTLFLVFMRMKKKKIVFKKSDDHIALRLVTMGYSVRKSVLAMYFFSIVIAVSSLIVAFGSTKAAGIILLIVVMLFFIMGKKVGMVRIED